MEVIDRIFFRKINPSDFRNIYEVAKPSGGNGQTYIEAAGISDDALIDFLQFGEISETKSAAESRFIYTINCYVVGENDVSDWVEFSPRKGRNYKISRQTLAHRHPAWSASNGFPEPTKDASGKYLNSESFSGIIDSLVIYIIRTTYRRYYAGFLNCQMMPSSWPTGIGLEAIFENDRRGMIVFKKEGPGYKADKVNPFMGVMGPCESEQESTRCIEDGSLLTGAIKLFIMYRQKREWCSESLPETAGEPAVGCVVNQSLRGISVTPQIVAKIEGDTPSHLKSWFKAFCDPTTKKPWIDGFADADLRGLGPYIAHLLDETKPEVPWPQTLPLSLQKAIKTIADPAKCGMYDKRVHDVLKFFGRAEGEFNPAFTDDDYQDVLHEQRVIRKRLKDMGQKQIVEWDASNNQAKSNNEDPDFLTVNEFLWWASDEDNQKKISKECEVKKMKAADYSTSEHQPTAKKAKVNLAKKEDVVLLRLCAALRAKPFAILAGHSGTGKSRMVRQLAYMTAAAHNHRALFEDANGQRLTVPGNFCMVQVKPNWHDSTDLLGFYSEMKGAFKGTDFVKFICRAYAYPDVPFFVCLDEMNLAPVEHYFAEYLSAIESRKLVKDVETMDKGGNVVKTETVMTDRLLPDEAWRNSNGAPDYSGLGCEYNQSQCWLEKHGLTIPRNLFVVGTVNMDESTNQFTRKVLDRAFTLEMTDADFEHFGESDPEPTFDDFAGDGFADALLSGAMIAKKPEPTAAQDDQARFKKQIENLTALKPVLDGTSFVVAYRFANEYMLYESAFAEMRKVMDVSSHDPAQQGTASANPAYEPEAFDDMILMKLLPRISGDQAVVMRIFVGESDPNKDSKKLDDADVGGLAKLLKQKGASFEKMQEIVRRGEANGGETLTFWP